jgi:hypothetical protein
VSDEPDWDLIAEKTKKPIALDRDSDCDSKPTTSSAKEGTGAEQWKYPNPTIGHIQPFFFIFSGGLDLRPQ